jgi:hypothetical protein
MKDLRYLRNSLRLPAGYANAIGSILNRLNRYQENLAQYAIAKIALGIRDIPQFNTERRFSEESFVVDNISQYNQGVYYGKIAETAPDEAKPLLFHYAENSLFGFMITSCMKYCSYSNRHGITVRFNEDPLQTSLKFRLHGFFPRIVEFFSVLGMTAFSVFWYDEETRTYSSSMRPDPYTNMNFSLRVEPSITLSDLLTLRYQHAKRRPMYKEYETDVLDFAILFACSSLARYRPFLFHRLIEGKEDTSYATMQEAYWRYKLFRTRIELSLIQGMIMGDPTNILKIPGAEAVDIAEA